MKRENFIISCIMNTLLFIFLIANVNVSYKLDVPISLNRNAKGEVQPMVENGVLMNEPGAPALPSIPLFVALQNGEKAIGIKVNSVRYRRLEGKYRVAPQQPPAILPFPGYSPEIRSVPPNERIYSSKSSYPSSPIELDVTGDFGGVPVTGIILHPFRYNPADSMLEVMDEIDFEVVTAPTSPLPRPPMTRMSASLRERALKRFVLNPEAIEVTGAKPDSALDYLIVTNQGMKPYFDTLAMWLNERGLKAEVALIDTAIASFPGRDNAERLRNFVKHVYLTRGLTFLLLGGDTQIIPDRVAYAMTSNAGFASDEDSLRADLYYADLDGTWDANGNGTFGEVDDSVDLYPDIFVGRVPVSNASQASGFIHKWLRYVSPTRRDYQAHELFFAEILWHDPYTDAGVGKNLIDSLHVPDSVQITKLYESLGNESPSSVMEAINSGANLQNHDGHGFYYVMGAGSGYLYSSNMDALANRDRPGILYSIGCWVGAFDYDAISEHYVNNPNGGGVAFIGNSRYGWGSPGNPGYGYSDKLDTEFYKWVFDLGVTRIGVAMALNKATFVPYSRQANVFRWHQYQVNLLGEPSMRIWRGRPGDLELNCEGETSPGQLLHVTVEPAVDGIVALSANGELLGTAPLSGGVTEIRLPQSVSADTVEVRVMADGFVDGVRHVRILHQGAHLSVAEIRVIDTLAAHPDSVLTPGDGGVMRFVIVNSGTETAGPSVFSVSSLSDSLNLSGTVNLPSVSPGDTTVAELAFSVGDVPFEVVKMVVVLDGDSSVMGMRVRAPFVKVVDFRSDSFIVSGDNRVELTLANIGDATAHNCTVRLRADDPDVSFAPDSFSLSEFQPGDTVLSTLMHLPEYPDGEHFIVEAVIDADGVSNVDSVIAVVGSRDYGSSFEDEQSVMGWQAESPWHVTSSRANTGARSWYCGNESTHRYPNNADFSLISPTFIAGDGPVLSFYLWFSVTTYGSDGLYVEIEHDGHTSTIDYIGSGGALDSLLGFWTDWALYTYDIGFLPPGDSFRVVFRFVSDDSDNEEGFYLDDVTLSNVVPIGVNSVSEGDEGNTSRPVQAFILSDGFRVRLYGQPNSPIDVELYDVTGRQLRQLKVMTNGRGLGSVEFRDLKPGIYIVRTSLGNTRALILR